MRFGTDASALRNPLARCLCFLFLFQVVLFVLTLTGDFSFSSEMELVRGAVMAYFNPGSRRLVPDVPARNDCSSLPKNVFTCAMVKSPHYVWG